MRKSEGRVFKAQEMISSKARRQDLLDVLMLTAWRLVWLEQNERERAGDRIR